MENNKIEKYEAELPTVKETALFLITKAEIDVQISTAKAFPRSVKASMDKAETMATLTEDIAASCNYALPRAGKTIEGPSVRLAEIIVNTWGNIRAGARVIDNDGKTVTAQGICHDLENNTCFTVEVKKKITGRDGKTYSEDMQVTTGQAACAIAFRNAVFKVVPAALIDPIYEKTKEVAKGKAETMVARRTKAVNYAHSLNITDEQICTKLEVKKIDDIDLDKLAVFRAILSGIKNMEITVNDAFGQPENLATNNQVEEATRFRESIAGADTLEKLNKLETKVRKLTDEAVRNELLLEIADKKDTVK